MVRACSVLVNRVDLMSTKAGKTAHVALKALACYKIRRISRLWIPDGGLAEVTL